MAVVALVMLAAGTDMRASDRFLRADLTIEAPVADVWNAWTTEAGVTSFFAPGTTIEPRVDGLYEIYFDPTQPPGQRGAEGMRILGFEPMRRFAFTWNAPPAMPTIRGQRTMVIVDLEPAGPTRTRLRFTHTGWGDGPEWDKAYEYFDHAWNAVVLPRLVHRFKVGPVDWKAIPTLTPVSPTLRRSLDAAPTASMSHMPPA
jgi:uncharacterized protein YndB with AHSA1/START domain